MPRPFPLPLPLPLPLSLPLIALALVAGCQRAAEPRADAAWVRLAAAPGRPAAGYLTLTGGAADRTLTGIASPAAARVELHETMRMDGMTGGAMAMRPLAQVAVPAGSTVRFAPGGRHLMLFGVDGAMRPGAALPLTLRFADGGTLSVAARTIAAGDPPPAS